MTLWGAWLGRSCVLCLQHRPLSREVWLTLAAAAALAPAIIVRGFLFAVDMHMYGLGASVLRLQLLLRNYCLGASVLRLPSPM